MRFPKKKMLKRRKCREEERRQQREEKSESSEVGEFKTCPGVWPKRYSTQKPSKKKKRTVA